MSFSLQHLRCEVLWRTTETCRFALTIQLLGEAKVCKQKVPILVEEYVFRLQVSVNNSLLVQVTK